MMKKHFRNSCILVSLICLSSNQVFADFGWSYFSKAARAEIDQNTQKQVQNLALTVSNYVRKEARTALFADPNGAFVEIDGKRYRVLYDRSHVVDNLVRFGTGQTLTELIAQLPLGVRQVSGFVRNRMEASVVESVVGGLSQLMLEKVIARALYSSYGYSADQIESAIHSYFDGAEFLQQRIDALVKQEDFQVVELTPAERAQANLITRAETSAGQLEITFQDVKDYYHDQIVLALNAFIRSKMIQGLAYASAELSRASANRAINYLQAAPLPGLMFGGASGGVAGLTLSFGLEKTRSYILDHVGQRSHDAAAWAGDRYLPDGSSFLRSKNDWVSEQEEEGVEDGFQLVEKKKATLGAWVEQFAENLLKPFAVMVPHDYSDEDEALVADILEPIADPDSQFYGLTYEQIEGLSEDRQEAYEDAIIDWQKRRAAAVSQRKEERALRGTGAQRPGIFSKVKSFFFR